LAPGCRVDNAENKKYVHLSPLPPEKGHDPTDFVNMAVLVIIAVEEERIDSAEELSRKAFRVNIQDKQFFGGEVAAG